MTRNDGYNEWREKEAANLEELVQKHIHYLQNPENCSDANKLYCKANTFSCGLGKYDLSFTSCQFIEQILPFQVVKFTTWQNA